MEEINEKNPAEKTFTQSEMDAIIRERLAREQGKYADYDELKEKASKLDQIEEQNKSELQKAQERADELARVIEARDKADNLRKIRESVSTETGVPVSLLTGETEEDCKAQADAINAYSKSVPKHPNLPDGGEPTPPTITKDDILKIADEKKRLKAIEDNIELFQ